jgi:hypothetical protein
VIRYAAAAAPASAVSLLSRGRLLHPLVPLPLLPLLSWWPLWPLPPLLWCGGGCYSGWCHSTAGSSNDTGAA